MVVARMPKSVGVKSRAKITKRMGEAVRETISIRVDHFTVRVAFDVIDSVFIRRHLRSPELMPGTIHIRPRIRTEWSIPDDFSEISQCKGPKPGREHRALLSLSSHEVMAVQKGFIPAKDPATVRIGVDEEPRDGLLKGL
jgi:hypothetical protein